MRNATLQHRPPADNVDSPGEQRHPIKHSRKIDQIVDACSILRRMTDSLQVNQEGDLETHIFSQGSQLARASSCTCTVSMATTTRSDAWPLRWALAGPGRGCLGWGEKKGRTLSTNFSPFHLYLLVTISFQERVYPPGNCTSNTISQNKDLSPMAGLISREWKQNA